MESVSIVVIDCGSATCKAGFAGDAAPRVVFSSEIEHPHHTSSSSSTSSAASSPAGEVLLKRSTEVEVDQRREVLSLTSPFAEGDVANWECMESIYRRVFERELRVRPQDCALMLTESPVRTRSSRQKTAHLVFETFQPLALYVVSAPILTLFSTGRTTGLVVDCGDHYSRTIPISEGYVDARGVGRLPLGGRHLTEYMTKLLAERWYSCTPAVACELKERYSYVALDFAEALSKPVSEQLYTLPDGQTLALSEELYRCPEALFDPSFIGEKYFGLSDLFQISLNECDYAHRDDLCANVVLAGGSTLFPGFAARVQRELSASAHGRPVKVSAAQARPNSAWVGGSILASLTSNQQYWISKEEYDECGPSIISPSCVF